jgi:hypothetical protein
VKAAFPNILELTSYLCLSFPKSKVSILILISSQLFRSVLLSFRYKGHSRK